MGHDLPSFVWRLFLNGECTKGSHEIFEFVKGEPLQNRERAGFTEILKEQFLRGVIRRKKIEL